MRKQFFKLFEKKKKFLTCKRTASNHTSSLVGHASVPLMIKFLAFCVWPVTSSSRAAAIQPDISRRMRNFLKYVKYINICIYYMLIY